MSWDQGLPDESGTPSPDLPASSVLLPLLFVAGTILALGAAAALAVGGAALAVALFISLGHSIGFMWVVGILGALLAGMMICVIACIVAAVRTTVAAFWRPAAAKAALVLDLAEEQLLSSLISDVCRTMGADLPTQVLLQAEPGAYVTQGKIQATNALAKGRLLVIGMPLMSVLTAAELRAILAHELAHFTGRDTVYSSMFLPAYVGALAGIEGMSDAEVRGFASLPSTLPVYVLRLYLEWFDRMNNAVSRAREYRADALAASTCGTKTFASALTRVVGASRLFTSSAPDHVLTLLKRGQRYVNYYDVFRSTLSKYPEAVTEAMEAESQGDPEENGSHPSLKSRLASLPVVDDAYHNGTPALALLSLAESYEQQLTEVYTHMLAAVASHRQD